MKINRRVKILLIGFLVLSMIMNVYFISQFKKTGDDIGFILFDGEEYVYIASGHKGQYTKMEKEGIEAFKHDFNVKAYALAPEKFDIVAQTKLLIEAQDNTPDGIVIYGSALSLTPYVNQAAEAGIPIVTVGSDLPDSKRLAYIGPDWYDIGVNQAEAIAGLIQQEGTVAMLGMVGSDSSDKAFSGFQDTMAVYEDIYVLGGYDDMGTIKEAERVTKKLVQEYDIDAIAGFDTNSGLGIVQALKELGLEDQIKVVCVGMTTDHLKLVKSGLVQKLIGQKYDLMVYYGLDLLYDYNHSGLNVTKNDRTNDVTNIPNKINTGIIEIDKTNIDDFFK